MIDLPSVLHVHVAVRTRSHSRWRPDRGIDEDVLVPSPSCPASFRHHQSLAVWIDAHTCAPAPTQRELTELRSRTAAGTGSLSLTVPRPSSPCEFAPQQWTVPSVV